MSYLAVKHLHILCAMLSGGLFLLRGSAMLAGSTRLQGRRVETAVHLVDTVLLSCALIMVFWSEQYPFVQPWLTAKVLALTLYIILGAIALKRGKSRGARIQAFAAALAVFAYIVSVALSKQPIPFS